MIRAFLICYATVLITSIKLRKLLVLEHRILFEGVCQRTCLLYAVNNIAYNFFKYTHLVKKRQGAC